MASFGSLLFTLPKLLALPWRLATYQLPSPAGPARQPQGSLGVGHRGRHLNIVCLITGEWCWRSHNSSYPRAWRASTATISTHSMSSFWGSVVTVAAMSQHPNRRNIRRQGQTMMIWPSSC